MNRRALFSDETVDYRCPMEPDAGDRVQIRFRAAKDDVDSVYLTAAAGGERQEMRMVPGGEQAGFVFYETEVSLSDAPYRYWFQIEKGEEICWYDKTGVSDLPRWEYAFQITPGFHTPDWAKGAIIYQIFVDRFRNGCPENDVGDGEYLYVDKQPVRRIKDWRQRPEPLDVNNFYGGDLQGVLEKLDYLKELGVEVIYFNPIFVSPSNHKYDIQDYDYIDPHYGKIINDVHRPVQAGETNKEALGYITRVTDKVNLEASNAFFAEVVEEAHRRGMRIILDGVFNHCGSFNKWMDRERLYEGQEDYETGAYVSEASPYKNFFRFTGGHWPYNGHYDGWWGHDTLPKLNYEASPELYDYIMKIGKKWVSEPYNVDGWRLDVAADLGHSEDFNHQFWRDFRKNVKEAKPDALILAEHYGNPESWLAGDQWDTVMNYDAFMEPLTWFLTGLEKHSDERRDDMYADGELFFRTMLHEMSRFHVQSLQVAMNELSNHDHSRFLTRTNRTVGRIGSLGAKAAEIGVKKNVLRMAVTVQMTWPGAPTIYYGDEAGLCGWTDPDNRRTYPWGDEDVSLIEFHKCMTKLHKTYLPLKTGSLKPLAAGRHLIAYGRFNEKCRLAVILNTSESPMWVEIPVWEIGVRPDGTMKRLMLTSGDSYSEREVQASIRDGILAMELPPESSVIFVENKEEG
ncbi:MAG: glycoside hydrolase family 13 protein [Lachnospiraceae bacterium]|nr:glycoside hydrolase family 13 protein [Lachnospiraceae bacterium]